MRPLLKVLAGCALFAGCVAASAWSVRMAWADFWFRQETVGGTEKAIAVTPRQAAYYYRLAQLESDANNRKATEALEKALSLNPSDGLSWVDLGLHYEAAGDLRRAEQCLLRAAEVDKQYVPRWTLANYYYRRNDTARFWEWARESAPMIGNDPLPLFRLCGRVTEDGKLIDRLHITNPDARAKYMFYLLTRNLVDFMGPASERVLEANRESDTPVLLAACDRLLQTRHGDEALAIWNRLADARRIPFRKLTPANGNVLTNGDLAGQPTSQGFDWRMPNVDGVSVSREESPAGLRFTFSGSQPESCELLSQFAPVQEKTGYKLSYRYRTSGIRPGAGLRWHITDPNGGMLNEGESLSSEAEVQREVSFITPAGCRLVRLSLRYDRVPGTVHIVGYAGFANMELRSVTSLP